MDIGEIAELINDRSIDYKIGQLQNYRKRIKGYYKKATNKIFSPKSISDEGWAFHSGGRPEMQFNIGFEDEVFRYGLAFSLEGSQSLPDVSILYPKIYKLNTIIREKPELFSDFYMWFWSGIRSKNYKVKEIPCEWIHPKVFIFLGKQVDPKNIDVEEILRTFDMMFPIYLEVETEEKVPLSSVYENLKFEFFPQEKSLVFNRAYTSIERETSIDIRHSIIQEKLYEKLVLEHGKENVSIENSYLGNRIDVVLDENNEYTFLK